jgi:hypothetical protein
MLHYILSWFTPSPQASVLQQAGCLATSAVQPAWQCGTASVNHQFQRPFGLAGCQGCRHVALAAKAWQALNE